MNEPAYREKHKIEDAAPRRHRSSHRAEDRTVRRGELSSISTSTFAPRAEYEEMLQFRQRIPRVREPRRLCAQVARFVRQECRLIRETSLLSSRSGAPRRREPDSVAHARRS